MVSEKSLDQCQMKVHVVHRWTTVYVRIIPIANVLQLCPVSISARCKWVAHIQTRVTLPLAVRKTEPFVFRIVDARIDLPAIQHHYSIMIHAHPCQQLLKPKAEQRIIDRIKPFPPNFSAPYILLKIFNFSIKSSNISSLFSIWKNFIW